MEINSVHTTSSLNKIMLNKIISGDVLILLSYKISIDTIIRRRRLETTVTEDV